VTVILDILI